jgi:hypothetical protein
MRLQLPRWPWRRQSSKQPLIAGKCVARETLTALKEMASAAAFRQIAWENGTKLMKIG